MRHPNESGRADHYLEMFIGRWQTEGKLITSPGKDQQAIHGTDIYEWLPGKFAVIHRVDVMMGPENVKSVEIIGFNPSTNKYPMHFIDNSGNSGSMEAYYENGVWKFVSPSLKFAGTFSKDGNTLTGKWEKVQDSDWIHIMDIKLTRM